MRRIERLFKRANRDSSGLYTDLFLRDLRSGGYSAKEVLWAYWKGFAPSTVRYLGITGTNVDDYLSERDYYAGHPYNRWTVLRVNDKLTLRYSLAPFSEYLPDYLLLISRSGDIYPLPDCAIASPRPESFEGLLGERGALAVKRLGGCGGEGFYLVEWDKEGAALVNGKSVAVDSWLNGILRSGSEYVVTEAVVQHEKYGAVWPRAVHCIRLQTVSIGGEADLLFGYVRFGCEQSEYCTGHSFGGAVFGDVDIEAGELGSLYKVDGRSVAEYPFHPDTGVSARGPIPHWDLIKSKCLEMHRYLSDCEYLGWDIAVTEEGFKILEVNSLTAAAVFQFFRPAMRDPRMRTFFEGRGAKQRGRHAG